jgi:hypothetical protein
VFVSSFSSPKKSIVFPEEEDGSCKDVSIGCELLSDCDEDDMLISTSPIKVSKPRSLRPRAHFAPEVSVVQIPSHREYSDDEKDRIWTSGSMLGMQARRNRVEWHWEGCNAENEMEEAEFGRDCCDNLIHPAHGYRRYV